MNINTSDIHIIIPMRKTKDFYEIIRNDNLTCYVKKVELRIKGIGNPWQFEGRIFNSPSVPYIVDIYISVLSNSSIPSSYKSSGNLLSLALWHSFRKCFLKILSHTPMMSATSLLTIIGYFSNSSLIFPFNFLVAFLSPMFLYLFAIPSTFFILSNNSYSFSNL